MGAHVSRLRRRPIETGAALILAILILFVAGLILTIGYLDQRAKRRATEDDLLIERLRSEYLRDHIPYGERLPE